MTSNGFSRISFRLSSGMKLRFWIVAIPAILSLTWTAVEGKKRSDTIKEILTSLLLNKYHSYVRPEKSGNGTTDESAEPLEIYVSMYIINIDVDTKNQTVHSQSRSRSTINEPLMMFMDDKKNETSDEDGVNELSFGDATGFWTPDLFFVTEKTGHLHHITKQNSFFRIFPQGETLYSQRLSLKTPCRMDLRKYPFDRQTCTLAVESYGYTADDIILKRKDDKLEDGSGEPSDFHVSYSISEKVVQMGKKYSRLELEISLKRVSYAQIFHVYLPLGLLVIISWISFWIRPSSHLPRLTTTVLTALTALSVLQMTREFFYFQKYLTALDIWTGFSLLLVFGAFFETIYVLGIRKDVKPKNQKEVPEIPSSIKGDGKVKSIVSGLALKDSDPDEIAKIAFPVTFLLFVFVYCIYVFI